MLTLTDCHPKLLLDRKPLRFGDPGPLLVDDLSVKMAEKLSNELVDLDEGNIFSNAAASTHAELMTYI